MSWGQWDLKFVFTIRLNLYIHTSFPSFNFHACYSEGLHTLFLIISVIYLVTNSPHVCLQTVRDSGAQCVKSLFRNKKELCSIGLELPARDTTRLTEVCHTQTSVQTYTKLGSILSHEISILTVLLALFQIHFVCLPGQCEGEDVVQQVRFHNRTRLRLRRRKHWKRTLLSRFLFHFLRPCRPFQRGCASCSGPSTFTASRTMKSYCSRTPEGWQSTETPGLRWVSDFWRLKKMCRFSIWSKEEVGRKQGSV